MTTLQDLIDQVRFRSNMEENQFVTDAELITYINSSLCELDDLLIATYEDYKMSTAYLSITSNLDGYNYFNLPSDFLKERQLSRRFGGIWLPMERIEYSQRNKMFYPFVGLMASGYISFKYCIMGQKCFVLPYTNAIADYQMDYIAKYIPLVDTTDELEPYMDLQSWHDYAVVDCCIKVLVKQELDASMYMAQKQELQMRVINAAKPRDVGGIKKISDTRLGNNYDYNLGSGWRWGR